MSVTSYSILVLTVAAATLGLFGLLVSTDALSRAAVAFGAALATLNTLVAHALVAWSRGMSTRGFLGAVLGGMVGRMALLLGSVVAGVLVLRLPQVPLVVSLLGYFTLFMVLELTLQHRAGRAAGAR